MGKKAGSGQKGNSTGLLSHDSKLPRGERCAVAQNQSSAPGRAEFIPPTPVQGVRQRVVFALLHSWVIYLGSLMHEEV